MHELSKLEVVFSNWVKLGDVCEKASSNFAQKDLDGKEGEYPVYGASGFIKNIDIYHQETAYIAVVKDGAGIGRTMFLPAKSSVIGTLQYLLPKDQVEAKYLYYAVKHMHLEKYFSGATIPHIYFRDYQKEKFKLPSKTRQKEIILIMERVEELIQARTTQLAEFDTLIKARFIELFGDVIHNSKGWQVRPFAEIASSRLGKMLDAKQQTGNNCYPYLANFNVQWFRFELDSLNQMDFNAKDRIEFELQDGDLLICEGGEIGRCAVWHNEIQPCYFQKALHRARCDQRRVHPYYLAWWFKYNCDHEGFSTIAGAKATIAHLPGVKLKQLQVVVPPLALQEQFVSFVEQTDKSKFENQISKNLLHKLIEWREIHDTRSVSGISKTTGA